MTNPIRIGKIKFKSGGEMRLLPVKKRRELSCAAEHLSTLIDDETLAVVFVTIQKDGLVIPNCSYDAGFSAGDLLAMLELAKVDLLEKIWPRKPQ